MLILLDEVVRTDYGQFTLRQGADGFDGDADRLFAGQTNGWVGAAVPGVVHAVLARRSGGSAVSIELHQDEPDLDEAEDVVEVSLEVSEGALSWETWAGESSGTLDVPSGTYRVRVSASGRDAGQAREFADGIVDWYTVQLWHAPPADDRIVRVGSQDAAYWHAERGGRRGA
ncbi:hypothetical protein B2K11_11740 [Microbacterium sp. B35-30]|nr:hypothetical protein B2K11_11740 [Microbacterium sp. B35-30]